MKTTFMIPVMILTFFAALSFSKVSAFASQTMTGDIILGKWINDDKDRTIEFSKKGSEYVAVVVAADDKALIGKEQISGLKWDGKTFKEGKLHVIKKDKTYPCTIMVKNNNTIEISGKVGFISKSQTWNKLK